MPVMLPKHIEKKWAKEIPFSLFPSPLSAVRKAVPLFSKYASKRAVKTMLRFDVADAFFDAVRTGKWDPVHTKVARAIKILGPQEARDALNSLQMGSTFADITGQTPKALRSTVLKVYELYVHPILYGGGLR